jgi:flagellar operon protein (TIGR03826 family)
MYLTYIKKGRFTMAIKNCKSCGKIFNALTAKDRICPICKQADVANFKKVKDYLYKNRGANIPTVSEETGVPQKDIVRYLREDRLEVADLSEIGIPCERCGVNIKSGRFCKKCLSEMNKELTGAIKSSSPLPRIPSADKKSNKMFTADFRQRRS